jgi:hypothetical protein
MLQRLRLIGALASERASKDQRRAEKQSETDTSGRIRPSYERGRMTRYHYNKRKKLLIAYLKEKMKCEDWHACWDASVDLAVLDAAFKGKK